MSFCDLQALQPCSSRGRSFGHFCVGTAVGDPEMPESAVRFAVRDPEGRRSATWKCWSPSGKNDVYLACRELAGALKTSLHQSGSWHVAYFRDFFEDRVPEEHRTNRGRFIDQWSRPSAIAPGLTLAFRIVTPWSSVTSIGDLPPSITLVPPPAEGRAIEFDIFLFEGAMPVNSWPGKNKQSTRLLGSYGLPNGTSVFVVWWEVDMPDLGVLRGTPKFYRGSGLEDLKSEGMRMLVFGNEPDGSKVIFDCVGRHEHGAT